MSVDRITSQDEFSRAKDKTDETPARRELPSCALHERGVTDQGERYARLAPSLTAVERRGNALLLTFAEGFDREALEEVVAVERHCCPFFQFAFDAESRALTVDVGDAAMRPALDAIASQLESVPPSPAGCDQEKTARAANASADPAMAPDVIADSGRAGGRLIGPIGTTARVAGGLAAITLPAALSGVTWWDVGTALAVLPLAALLAAGAVDSASRSHPWRRSRPKVASWIRDTLALALVLGPGTALTFVSPVDGTAIWIFLGLSLIIAAGRGDAGCEVVAISNAITGRREATGCVIYAAIDAAEARTRRHFRDGSAGADTDKAQA